MSDLLAKLLTWWGQLALREQRVITGGAAIVSVLILYLYLWEPLADKVTSLREQVADERALLQWVGSATQKIKALQAEGAVAQTEASQSLLVSVNNSLQKAQLSSFADQNDQTDSGNVMIRFREVPFDQLLQWFALLWKQYGIKVNSLTVTAQDTEGLVSATVSVQRG